MTAGGVLAQDATAIAAAVRGGKLRARDAMDAALAAISHRDAQLNCFTHVMLTDAFAAADAIDARIATGEDPGPLAGVPFAAKNLFDIAGVTTLAGSKILADNPPAQRDATVVTRLKKAGACLVGATNMDEFAYGFVTENAHYGVTHNPHDMERVAGGSSGGSAAAVAAGFVPLALGSDTNGSIRVPASFCGIFGLKPTYGRISRAGAFLFSASLDHVGPFARSVRDLALTFDLLHGPDARDPICSARPIEPVTPQLGQPAERGTTDLRIAVLGGYFRRGGQPEVFAAVDKAAQALGATEIVELPDADLARAAAFLITACEGGNLHFDRLRTRPADFDPAVVDRLMAGALIPASWYLHAQRFRRLFRDRARDLFQRFDILLAPATPCPAIRAGQQTILFNGQETPARPNLGVFTQPLSFLGLPVVSAPVFARGSLPLGVQIVGAPYREISTLRAAQRLEELGIAAAIPPSGPPNVD